MKAITLTQPWATLVAIGAKRIETRSWGTRDLGPLAIHAAKSLGPAGGMSGLVTIVSKEPFWGVLSQALHFEKPEILAMSLPLGAVLATAWLDACLRTESVSWDIRKFSGLPYEREFGDYRSGRYAWIFSRLQALEVPIPAKGHLGLWHWEAPK